MSYVCSNPNETAEDAAMRENDDIAKIAQKVVFVVTFEFVFVHATMSSTFCCW
jgi:hypothetical protein